MKLPKPNELIKVFNKHYPNGKLRYFKSKSPDFLSPICVYANGQTKETNDGGIEYWDRWEYPKFVSSSYEKYKIDILQYQNLRKHFNKTIKTVLGKNYYNMGMDVYECDRITCEDIIKKTKPKGFFYRLFNK